MAIVPHIGGSYVAGTDYTTASAAAGSSLAVNKPTGVVDGITLRAFVYSSVSAGAVMTPPSGWTLDFGLTARRGGMYSKKIPSAAAETATSYTWSTASAGRILAVIWIDENEASTPVDVTGAWSTEATTATAASVSPANAGDLLIQLTYWNNSSTTVTSVNVASGFTDGVQVSSPTTGNTSGIDVSFKQLTSAGATGTAAQTGTPTPTNMSSVLIAFSAAPVGGSAALSGAGTLSVSGQPAWAATVALGGSSTLSASSSGSGSGTVSLSGSSSLTAAGTPAAAGTVALSGVGTLLTPSLVNQFITNQPMNVAHRGGSADWAEMTLDAYAKAAAWNQNMALEVSCQRTSDGLWMASHDSTTDRVFGVHYDINSTPWSTLQTLRTTVGNQPPCLLTDVLAAYPNRVIFVDNKQSSFLSPWLDLLDSYGGASRIVVKGYGPQAADMTKADAATARGYQTWGYYYHADTVNLASTQSHWSILGEDAVGAPPGDATDWAAIQSYGKPVLAHIIATKTQKTYADTFTPSGYMVSGVEEVVPQTPAAVPLSGASSLTTGGVPGFPATVALGSTGTLSASGLGSGTAALSGAGVLTITATPRLTGVLNLSGSTTLTASAAVVAPPRDLVLESTRWPSRWAVAPAPPRFAVTPN